MISKKKLKEQIDKFPKDEIFIDELIDSLIFIEKLKHRILLSEQGGQSISEDDLKNEIEKWSK